MFPDPFCLGLLVLRLTTSACLTNSCSSQSPRLLFGMLQQVSRFAFIIPFVTSYAIYRCCNQITTEQTADGCLSSQVLRNGNRKEFVKMMRWVDRTGSLNITALRSSCLNTHVVSGLVNVCGLQSPEKTTALKNNCKYCDK